MICTSFRGGINFVIVEWKLIFLKHLDLLMSIPAMEGQWVYAEILVKFDEEARFSCRNGMEVYISVLKSR